MSSCILLGSCSKFLFLCGKWCGKAVLIHYSVVETGFPDITSSPDRQRGVRLLRCKKKFLSPIQLPHIYPALGIQGKRSLLSRNYYKEPKFYPSAPYPQASPHLERKQHRKHVQGSMPKTPQPPSAGISLRRANKKHPRRHHSSSNRNERERQRPQRPEICADT